MPMQEDLKEKILMDKKTIPTLFSLLAISLLSFPSSYAEVNETNIVEDIELFTPQDKPFGLSYQDHIKNFWNWFVSIPKEQHPEKDLTGEGCANGQNNSTSEVFYLSGNSSNNVERVCEIPNGKGILIPVIIAEMADKEIDLERYPNPTVENLSQIVKKDQDSVTNMYLKINDNEYQKDNISEYRVHTDAFNLNFSKGNIFGVPEGSAIAVADGHYLLTKPLPKGEHNIYWNASLLCEGDDCIDNKFHQEVKYTLKVD